MPQTKLKQKILLGGVEQTPFRGVIQSVRRHNWVSLDIVRPLSFQRKCVKFSLKPGELSVKTNGMVKRKPSGTIQRKKGNILVPDLETFTFLRKSSINKIRKWWTNADYNQLKAAIDRAWTERKFGDSTDCKEESIHKFWIFAQPIVHEEIGGGAKHRHIQVC